MTTSVPTTSPPEGFMPWMDPYGLNKDRPHKYRVVEIWREGYTEFKSISPRDLHPMMNVAGLYWRPVM